MDKFEFAQRFQADKAKYYRIAYSYVKNEHDALDVMGEASYKALRSLKALKTPEYFSSWMTTRSGNGIAPASSCTSLRVTPTKTSPGYSGSRNRL